AQVHHARKFGGLRDLRHKDTVPVCPWHHTEAPDSIHRERNRVEENYGASEDEMVNQTRRDVAELSSRDVRYAK
ncbi:MAG: hypothetical protein ACRDAM_13235, partial [Casimicrobium sp.]